MMSVIHIDSFQKRFVNGLLFSMIEGLSAGEEIQLLSSKNFEELVLEVSRSGIQNLIVSEISYAADQWQAKIRKESLIDKPGTQSCCGRCSD